MVSSALAFRKPNAIIFKVKDSQSRGMIDKEIFKHQAISHSGGGRFANCFIDTQKPYTQRSLDKCVVSRKR